MVVETRKDIRGLALAQKRTEQNLQTLIQTLNRAVTATRAGRSTCSREV